MGGLFRDNLGTFRGAFYCNVGAQNVFYAEVHGIISAIEFAARNGWRNIWLESDSQCSFDLLELCVGPHYVME